MAKRRRSVSLSFVLLRFAIVMLGCMLLCCLTAYVTLVRLQITGVVYQAYTASRQAERVLTGKTESFQSPGDDFLPDYALFGPNGDLRESNVAGRRLQTLATYLREEPDQPTMARHTYADGNIVVLRWRYLAEFANPALRDALPPFEHLWLASLGISLALCLLLSTLWLRRRLAAKLKLFGEVSRKVGSQELDFAVPRAGIREYDQALDAMEHMRKALYDALTSQWAAQRTREAEIAALAHDLKTPLTLVGGNAELLLDEALPANCRDMVKTIVASNDRAKRYVESLLEASVGGDEAFEVVGLPEMFDELCRSVKAIAEAAGVCLQVRNRLKGTAILQRDHMVRGLGNVVLNAIEHTPVGGNAHVEGDMVDGGWRIVVRDEGPGFSEAALCHGTEHLWRGDAARSADGHNGLGLWFASEVVKAHGGKLHLGNGNPGGIVEARFTHRAR